MDLSKWTPAQILSSFVVWNNEEKRLQMRKPLMELISIDEETRKVIIENTDNVAFAKVARELELPQQYIDKRFEMERKRLEQADEYPVQALREAFCDLVFQDNANNILLTIKTIEERALYVEDYGREYEQYSKTFAQIKKILTCSDDEFLDKIDVVKIISKTYVERGVKDLLRKLFEKAEKDFQAELGQKVEESASRLLDGVEPKIYQTLDGKRVKYYSLENQSANQRDFAILSRTVYVGDLEDHGMLGEDGMQKFIEYNSRRDHLCYSVVGQNTSGGFGSSNKVKVAFGFSNLGEGEMISCNHHDGQTGQIGIKKGKCVQRQEFLPLDRFMKRTPSYNEVAFEKPETILPTMVISFDNEPTEIEIATAASLDIPIIHIDVEKYPTPDLDEADRDAKENWNRKNEYYNNGEVSFTGPIYDKLPIQPIIEQ